ncbi:hypothetical protein HDU96_009900 [Phlyctochytrium bullatum]|nr:hypothetical protein HDU96_009900 [Phlyctochytrium bullatum]
MPPVETTDEEYGGENSAELEDSTDEDQSVSLSDRTHRSYTLGQVRHLQRQLLEEKVAKLLLYEELAEMRRSCDKAMQETEMHRRDIFGLRSTLAAASGETQSVTHSDVEKTLSRITSLVDQLLSRARKHRFPNAIFGIDTVFFKPLLSFMSAFIEVRQKLALEGAFGLSPKASRKDDDKFQRLVASYQSYNWKDLADDGFAAMVVGLFPRDHEGFAQAATRFGEAGQEFLLLFSGILADWFGSDAHPRLRDLREFVRRVVSKRVEASEAVEPAMVKSMLTLLHLVAELQIQLAVVKPPLRLTDASDGEPVGEGWDGGGLWDARWHQRLDRCAGKEGMVCRTWPVLPGLVLASAVEGDDDVSTTLVQKAKRVCYCEAR